MRPPTNNWRKSRTEYCFYAEIGTDIITRNSQVKTHNRTTQRSKKDVSEMCCTVIVAG